MADSSAPGTRRASRSWRRTRSISMTTATSTQFIDAFRSSLQANLGQRPSAQRKVGMTKSSIESTVQGVRRLFQVASELHSNLECLIDTEHRRRLIDRLGGYMTNQPLRPPSFPEPDTDRSGRRPRRELTFQTCDDCDWFLPPRALHRVPVVVSLLERLQGRGRGLHVQRHHAKPAPGVQRPRPLRTGLRGLGRGLPHHDQRLGSR